MHPICSQATGVSSRVGCPLLTIGRWKLYTPIDWLGWYGRWHAPAAQSAFRTAAWVSVMGVLAIAALIIYRTKQNREQMQRESEHLHGSAHWASPKEVAQTGLLGSGRGVYVGAWRDPGTPRYINDGPEDIMAFAPHTFRQRGGSRADHAAVLAPQDHWQKSCQALLVGVALYVLYAEKNKTLNGIVAFLSDPTRTVAQFMLDTDHDVVGNGWPVVARNTATSDFSDLMNQHKPVSLYLLVPPSDKDRLRPLIRLMVNQIVRNLTEKMEFKDGRSVAGYKHRLLLLADEFPSLGKQLDVFEESLAFIAGYGLKAYLIIQDISQLWTAYGKDESIFSNCHVRVAYAPNKIETAELLSKMTGIATIVKQSHSFSGSLYGSHSNISTSTQETQRPLLTADEVMRLPAARKDAQGNVIEPGDMLIFMAGQTPIYGKQILYFLDPTFSA